MTSATEAASERLDIEAVARRLGVHKNTVFRWIHKGLRGIRLEAERETPPGRRLIVSQKALDTFLEAGRRLNNNA